MEKTTAAPELQLDVYPGTAPAELRRRLHAQAAGCASVLPGGLVLEESTTALTYRLPLAGGWRAAESEGALVLTTDEGHVLTVRDGRLTLTVAR